MAILTNKTYYSGAYLTGAVSSRPGCVNEFFFPLGRQEKNLAIYSTSTTSNASKSGSYMFKQTTADTATAFNLKIQTYLDNTYQELLVLRNDALKAVHEFSITVSKPFNKICIGADGSARDTLAIFTMQGTLPVSTHLGITVTVTNVTQGSFEFGDVMIVDRDEAVTFLPSSTDDANVGNYLETEPFKIQGEYGPRICFAPSGAINNKLVDIEVIPKSFSGTMRVYRYNGSNSIDINFTSPYQLTCASINQMVSKVLFEKHGSLAYAIFKNYNKISWVNFNLTCNINCYYHNTKDIIKAHKNGVLTEWKLTNKTVTLTNATKGALINNVFYLGYSTETSSLNLNTAITKINITGTTHGDYVVIPNLKKQKLYLGEAATSRYQCLFGESSIDGILNYYTERGTLRLPYSSNLNDSFSLYCGSGDIGIDYKIIPCGLNFNNSSGQAIKCNQLSLSNSNSQIYSLSNNYFKTNPSSTGTIVTKIFNNTYSAHGTSGASQQVVYVYLFDEDEFNSYTDKTAYNNAVTAYYRSSFIPTAPDTLTESTVGTLSGITNGLLKNIRFGVKAQGNSGNVNGPYIAFGNGTIPNNPRSYGYYPPITVLNFSSYLSSKVLQSDSIQKENFTFTSCESIFFDGVPHPCNKDYYLTGNMVMVPAYNRQYFSKYFHLFIGARRITQTILNKTIGYYGPIDFTCDYFSYQGSSDTYWLIYEPTFNFRDINETDFRIDNKIASIEDLNKKAFSYYAPSLIYSELWSSTYGNTYNGYFKYFNAHMFDPTDELMGYVSKSVGSGGLGVDSNLKVRGVQLYKIGSGYIRNVYENERDIKPMIYPCYSGATSTTVINTSGICISEPSNTNITYIYDLKSNYNAFLNGWVAYTHNTAILTGFTNLIVYNDGTISDSVEVSASVGVSVAIWDYNSGNIGLYTSGGAGIGPIDFHVPGGTSNDQYIFSNKYKNTFDSFISNTVPSLAYGESDLVISQETHLPTISSAFNSNSQYMSSCVILIKFDFIKQLYYMDVSFSLKRIGAWRIGAWKIENWDTFKEDFSAYAQFNGATTSSIYPLSDNKELLNTVHLDDDTVTVSFRIYETNKVPFNVNGRNMYLYINLYLLDEGGAPYGLSLQFYVSKCLIHSDASYQNWLFHYVPCIENKDIASGINASMSTNNKYWTLSSGSFSSNDTGLKLIYTTNSGSTYIYAATWSASSNKVNLYNSTAVDTGTCIVTSAVIISTHKLTGAYKNAIPFNFNTSVFPLVQMFNLMSTSNVVGQWYLLHYSQNINYGKYVYSTYNGSSTSTILSGTTYNRNVYDVALKNGGKAPIFVGFRPSGTTTNPYLLHGINIKYVDMSYLNDITHNNLYF